MFKRQIQSNVIFAEQIWAVTISQTFASMQDVERERKKQLVKTLSKGAFSKLHGQPKS